MLIKYLRKTSLHHEENAMHAANHMLSIFNVCDSRSYLSDSSEDMKVRSSMLLPFLVGVIIPMKCE